MLGALRGVSPASEGMSDGTLERNRAEKALITKTPNHVPYKSGVKNYSDKNGNDVIKSVHKGRRTFAFWTLVTLLLILAVGNLVLTFTILAVLRLGHGLESMEFLPEQRAVKFLGKTALQHVYKRDGLLESFRDEPLQLSSDGGSVVLSLQTRTSRAEPRLVVNATGVFLRGLAALELRDPATGEVVLSTSSGSLVSVPEDIKNLHARQIWSSRVTAPADEDLSLHSDASAYLRGAEGTHMESKELFWSADQDIHVRTVNGSIVLSGKEGVYIDVRYLPLAPPPRAPPHAPPPPHAHAHAGQYKVCVCMPQGRLFRVAVPPAGAVACHHVHAAGDLNPCI